MTITRKVLDHQTTRYKGRGMSHSVSDRTPIYAVLFKAKEAKSADGSVVTWEGTLCVVTVDSDGWGPTSVTVNKSGVLPTNTKQWNSKESAEKFMDGWTGHPWYNKPASFEVVEIQPKTRIEVMGFERVP